MFLSMFMVCSRQLSPLHCPFYFPVVSLLSVYRYSGRKTELGPTLLFTTTKSKQAQKLSDVSVYLSLFIDLINSSQSYGECCTHTSSSSPIHTHCTILQHKRPLAQLWDLQQLLQTFFFFPVSFLLQTVSSSF